MTNSNFQKPSNIEVEMKIGILDTIAKQIYSDSKVKIREAVANSLDNKANWFIIYADVTSRKISLIDDGIGITKERFEEIFKHMGCGTQRKDKYSNSYFGLGLMSIIELGEKSTIISKTKEKGEVIKLEIDCKKIFSEEMRDKPLSDMKNFLTINPTELSEREKLSVLSYDEIESIIGNFPNSFTEIIIENINIEVFNNIISDDFKIELSQILPIKIDESNSILQYIKDPKAVEWIRDIMSNKIFCPTIEIFFGKLNGDKQYSKLFKYYPNFKNDIALDAADIEYGILKNVDENNDVSEFAYYYIYSTEDLEEKEKTSTETGFWVRNMNFLVKKADFFQKRGTRQKMIHEPLKNWLFGEIFHQGMTDCLVVNRDEYVWDSFKFNDFLKKIGEKLSELNKELRDAWKYGLEISRSIIEPFNFKVTDKTNPFNRTDETLTRMGIIKNPEDTTNVLAKLHENRKPDLEDEEKSIYKIINKNKQNITLADDEFLKVIIDHNISKDFVKQREENSTKIIIKISPQIFAAKKVTFLGKSFEVIFVAQEKNSSGISINTENQKIFINPFNHDVFKYSVSFIDVYIALELADIYSRNKEEMKSYLVDLLGFRLIKSDVIPKKYLSSLRDELQRRN
jgi:hypothetical protein